MDAAAPILSVLYLPLGATWVCPLLGSGEALGLSLLAIGLFPKVLSSEVLLLDRP